MATRILTAAEEAARFARLGTVTLTRFELSTEIAQTIHNRPEQERKQQNIDAPHHPKNQRPKVVLVKVRSESLDEVKQWNLHGRTRILNARKFFCNAVGSAPAPSERSTAHSAVTRWVEGSSCNQWSKHIYLEWVMAIIRRGDRATYYERS